MKLNKDIKVDFKVIDNDFYLFLNGEKIKSNELFLEKNKKKTFELLNNRKGLIFENNNIDFLYSNVSNLIKQNKKNGTSLQPNISIYKEVKQYAFNEFMEKFANSLLYNFFHKNREFLPFFPFELFNFEEKFKKENFIKFDDKYIYKNQTEKINNLLKKIFNNKNQKNCIKNYENLINYVDLLNDDYAYNICNKEDFLIFKDQVFLCKKILKFLLESKNKNKDLNTLFEFMNFFSDEKFEKDKYFSNIENYIFFKKTIVENPMMEDLCKSFILCFWGNKPLEEINNNFKGVLLNEKNKNKKNI